MGDRGWEIRGNLKGKEASGCADLPGYQDSCGRQAGVIRQHLEDGEDPNQMSRVIR